ECRSVLTSAVRNFLFGVRYSSVFSCVGLTDDMRLSELHTQLEKFGLVCEAKVNLMMLRR
ncbi:MAG: hypothetical protein K8R45_12445, partial [Desulfobacterales bacterium]|nr:hypothetical protein [Desulfobacterales bacterium]